MDDRTMWNRSLLLMLLWVMPLAAQSPATVVEDDPFALDRVLPVDDKLVTGTLDNGLRYWVRSNTRPEKRAEVRLVVNAGSILEDPDQLGLAHFVEHMAFNGSEHFEKQELVEYLESIGMRFGPDVNAYTSFDETVYMLQLPTDDSAILDRGFEILEDWAHAVSFEDDEIDKERGVVIEEWRSGRGAFARLRDQQFPVLFKDSLYAERNTIGTKEILESFEPAVLKRYYADWYRPNLMAVIVVGDIDPQAIVAKITEHFGDLENPAGERARFLAEVPDHDETLVSVVTDVEMPQTSVSIAFKADLQEEDRVGDYRRNLVEGLFYQMLNLRLAERSQEANPPYLGASASGGALVRTKAVNMLSAGVGEGKLDAAITTLLIEAERARRHGFVAGELERQKLELLSFYEQAYNERDKFDSRSLASEYVRAFLENEPTPGIEFERDLARRVVPGITLEDVNSVAERFLAPTNRVILIAGPEGGDAAVVDREQLLMAFDRVQKATIPPYQDGAVEGPLMTSLPNPGRIVARQRIEALDVDLWTLSNGIEVILRPTDFQNEEILFQAWSPGGSSRVDDIDYVPAVTATAVLGQSGVGRFDLTQLRKTLAGTVAGASPMIDELGQGVSGSASPEDLETALQLMHLYLTEPRRDQQAFDSFLNRLEGIIANRLADPETVYRDRREEVLTQGHFRRRPLSAEVLEELDLDRSWRVYRELFSDLGSLDFVFVGNFDPAEIEPLITRYVASLPSNGGSANWRDVGVRSPRGVVKDTVYGGLEDKARVDLVFSGDFDWNWQNRYRLTSLASALRIRLRERLREDMGGTYGVAVSGNPDHWPRESFSLEIGFGCAPESAQQLRDAVFEEIRLLKENPADQSLIDKIAETQRRQRETDIRENGFWLGSLAFLHRHGESLEQILEFDQRLATLTPVLIQEAARAYLDEENFVETMLLPEANKPTEVAEGSR